ncbi:hypothetical protein M9H77_04869 [Catharanthus roseus]|uniref:Uncharacterized protein n=1 Tax=Catharanthus roseus TaxID=4058 RepID=A0ACC0CFF6_CATRO|nr:hypothetical protein M9H77_04869 [Catharanthus roseus]
MKSSVAADFHSPLTLSLPLSVSSRRQSKQFGRNYSDSGKLSGRIVDSDMHDVGRFLNRLLGLPPEIQNRHAFQFYKHSHNILPSTLLLLLRKNMEIIKITTVSNA